MELGERISPKQISRIEPLNPKNTKAIDYPLRRIYGYWKGLKARDVIARAGVSRANAGPGTPFPKFSQPCKGDTVPLPTANTHPPS